MNIFQMVFREITRRKLNFFLGMLAVVIAAGCLAGSVAVLRAYELRTDEVLAESEKNLEDAMKALEDDFRKITKRMGFNVLILPKNVNLTEFYSESYANEFMPENYVDKLAEAEIITVRHLVPSLQQKLKWPEKSRTVLMMGVRDEVPLPHRDPKKPMEQPILPNHVILGHELGKSLGLEKNQEVEFHGRSFTVQNIYPERGNKDDITIWLELNQAQEIADKKGLINGILALECNCAWGDLPAVRQEIERVLPDTYVIEKRTQALARAESRNRAAEEAKLALLRKKAERAAIEGEVERLTGILVPLVVVVAALWVGLLAWLNVRERREEIGILRAIGVRSMQIMSLFLVRAALVGFIGGGVGYLAGWLAGIQLGSNIVENSLAGNALVSMLNPTIFVLTLVLAPLVAVMAGWIPAQLAAQQDPAEILRGE